MLKKKLLSYALLSAVCCSAFPAWVSADTQDTIPANTSKDKMGMNSDPKYGVATAPAPEKTTGEATTSPSGKRHRTHRKHGAQASSADANKTINSGDVTPSK